MSHDVRNKIFAFIQLHTRGQDLDDDSDIFKLGYVSSLFAMQLVNFIENEFNIKVRNEELKIDNFNSLGNITAFVSYKLEE